MKYPNFKGDEPCTEIGPEMYCTPPSGMSGKYVGAEVMREACARCPMLQECHDWALHHEADGNGFWGGMTGLDRREKRRKLGIILQDPMSHVTNSLFDRSLYRESA